MSTWLWLLLCLIILPRGATPFITSSTGVEQRRSIQSTQHKLLFASPTSTNNNDVWVPPSQQLLKTKSTIFKIQQPEELLEFISEDDRLCVIKVYASWCAACKKFDLRYRKLASKYGDKYTTANATIKEGKIRFAELQYDNPQNTDLCDSVLDTSSFPYILIYKGGKGKVRGFHCTPAKFQLLQNTVEELLAEEEECGGGGGVDESFQRQVVDLGLADRR